MSYDISFKVKVDGLDDYYVKVGNCTANITWNLREMIEKSTGLDWINEANNGLCKDVIPHIINGLNELITYPEKYKQYEASNDWGTIDGCKKFFTTIIDNWNDFTREYSTRDLVDVVYFWIE